MDKTLKWKFGDDDEDEIDSKGIKSMIDSERNNKARQGIIIINQEFTPQLMEWVIYSLKASEHNRLVDEIEIYINSNGGEVTSLLPMVDLIDTIKKPVKTIVLGKAYSCGALLLLCGHKGKRAAYKNSEILLHEVAGGTIAKSSQMVHDVERIKRFNALAVKFIRERTRMSEIQISRFMDSNQDIFITAKEALEYGIIDEIVGQEKPAEKLNFRKKPITTSV